MGAGNFAFARVDVGQCEKQYDFLSMETGMGDGGKVVLEGEKS
jgi:hypothetical protein